MFRNAKKVDVKIPERNNVNWQLYKGYRVVTGSFQNSMQFCLLAYYHPLYDTSYVNVVGPTVEYLMTQCSLSSVSFHCEYMCLQRFLYYF